MADTEENYEFDIIYIKSAKAISGSTSETGLIQTH